MARDASFRYPLLKAAELGRVLGKEEYQARLPNLRTALLQAQARLEGAKFPVVVLMHGLSASGVGETANLLNEWFDARYLSTEAYALPAPDERERPPYWRYWMWLPPAGRIGIFLGAWYAEPLEAAARGELSERALSEELTRINAFERTLAEAGVLFIKLWFHISKKQQKKSLKAREASKDTRYSVTRQDWQQQSRYEKYARVSERLLRETSSGLAPWTVVEAADDHFRSVTTAQTVLDGIERRLATPAPTPPSARPEPQIADPKTLLDRLDLSLSLAKDVYAKELGVLGGRLGRLANQLQKQRRGAIFLFEGWDAAGKGGAVRRLVWSLDARQYRIIPIAAPTDEERAHHYLWRFWRHLPRRGRITIYDRSWYGRVLVERVENLARQDEWQRAYTEINDFERELVRDGIVLVKFWLHISREEQLRRFQEREREPWKQHKITAEDYRNRSRSNQYELAASEMIEKNSTEYAPFTLIEAEDKRYARVRVMKTVCAELERALER